MLLPINLQAQNSTDVDAAGNEHKLQGSYTNTSGNTKDMTDVWLIIKQEVL